MDLVLTRKRFLNCGVFGVLTDKRGIVLAQTLEHAYPTGEDWAPKIPIGTYKCVRGQHQLEGMTGPFETFEITDVPGHSNILIHAGNFDNDSSGCVLVGRSVVPESPGSSVYMVTNSRSTFAAFLSLQGDATEFTLVVQ